MKKFDFKELYRIIEKRIESKAEDSYSYKLCKNPKLLNKKIIGEANELIMTKNKRQVIWEATDLLYFLLVFLVKRKVKLNPIEKKLGERNKNAEKLRYYRKRCKKRRLKPKRMNRQESLLKPKDLNISKKNIFISKININT